MNLRVLPLMEDMCVGLCVCVCVFVRPRGKSDKFYNSLFIARLPGSEGKKGVKKQQKQQKKELFCICQYRELIPGRLLGKASGADACVFRMF